MMVQDRRLRRLRSSSSSSCEDDSRTSTAVVSVVAAAAAVNDDSDVISRCCQATTDHNNNSNNNDYNTLRPIHSTVRCCSSLLNRLQPSQQEHQQQHQHQHQQRQGSPVSWPTEEGNCQRHRHQYNFQEQLPHRYHLHHQHHQQQHLIHHYHLQRQQRYNDNTNTNRSRSDKSSSNNNNSSSSSSTYCIVSPAHSCTASVAPNCSVLSLVFALVLLLSVVTNTRWPAVMANPVLPTSTVPKWINPCNYDLDSRSGEGSAAAAAAAVGGASTTDGGANVDFQSAEAKTLYDQIVSEVESTESYVNEIKHQFVEETFGDPSFIEEFEWISYEWLPKIPAATAENFESPEVSLKNSFEYLQHFAVAIEQMTMDQMIYEGSHLDQFRTMEKRLRNVLCLLQGAMLRLLVEANPDVTRGVMSEEYRSIEMDAMRNVRDYIIMREYAHALKFIHQAFGYFQHLQESSDDS